MRANIILFFVLVTNKNLSVDDIFSIKCVTVSRSLILTPFFQNAKVPDHKRFFGVTRKDIVGTTRMLRKIPKLLRNTKVHIKKQQETFKEYNTY